MPSLIKRQNMLLCNSPNKLINYCIKDIEEYQDIYGFIKWKSAEDIIRVYLWNHPVLEDKIVKDYMREYLDEWLNDQK